ncbi:MAG: M28 family peptidase [Saprospiraceae bacterium]|nr:M28 family peptidase [Lewinella sp.]
MKKTTNFSLLLFLFSISPLLVNAQSEYRQIDHYLELIRQEYSGANAMRTADFVSEQWRLPGNPGFDTSIYYVMQLLEQAGFVLQEKAGPGEMSYRLESYPMSAPAWQPLDAQLVIKGENEPLLKFSTNRNMISINSFSTPEEGLTAEVIYLPNCDEADLQSIDVKGKIVMSDCNSWQLFSQAVLKAGAVGVLPYYVPSYNQPENYPNSIPFTRIPFNSDQQSWAINLSYAARQRLLKALEKGPVELKVTIRTQFRAAEELALIAEIPGEELPEERFVFSAHVQEPGANDNASGVGALAEMARVAGLLRKKGQIKPARTITFLWGDEIRATRRYIQQDEKRAMGIRWGMSLDMVGEDTEKTGGSFLIEKMPDPSAIWTRGADEHTEWGAGQVSRDQFNPHYFNNIIEAICRRQALHNGWKVKTNPFEGGSDHQPFLDAGIPGLLLWHFTDVFYHTDADRIDKVSATTLANVGASALTSALLLCNGTTETALDVLEITDEAAHNRLKAELALSETQLNQGATVGKEKEILESWIDWYSGALAKVTDIPVQDADADLQKEIDRKVRKIRKWENKVDKTLK